MKKVFVVLLFGIVLLSGCTGMLTARENADNTDLTVAEDIAGDASDKQVTDDDLQLSPDETENDPL